MPPSPTLCSSVLQSLSLGSAFDKCAHLEHEGKVCTLSDERAGEVLVYIPHFNRFVCQSLDNTVVMAACPLVVNGGRVFEPPDGPYLMECPQSITGRSEFTRWDQRPVPPLALVT